MNRFLQTIDTYRLIDDIKINSTIQLRQNVEKDALDSMQLLAARGRGFVHNIINPLGRVLRIENEK